MCIRDRPIPVRLTVAHPFVDAVRGSVAIERGPVTYCLESHDQVSGVDPDHVELVAGGALRVAAREDLLGGTLVVEADGLVRDDSGWSGHAGWATRDSCGRFGAAKVSAPRAQEGNREADSRDDCRMVEQESDTEEHATAPVVTRVPGRAKEGMSREDDEGCAVDLRVKVLRDVLNVVVREEEPRGAGGDPRAVPLAQEQIERGRRQAEHEDVRDRKPGQEPQLEERRDEKRQTRRTPRGGDVLARPRKAVRDPVVRVGCDVRIAPVEVRDEKRTDDRKGPECGEYGEQQGREAIRSKNGHDP